MGYEESKGFLRFLFFYILFNESHLTEHIGLLHVRMFVFYHRGNLGHNNSMVLVFIKFTDTESDLINYLTEFAVRTH